MMTTEHVSVFPGENFAGRTDGGKIRVDLQLAFDSDIEVYAFFERNGIPKTVFEHRPDGASM